jgi:hypothetical protein
LKLIALLEGRSTTRKIARQIETVGRSEKNFEYEKIYKCLLTKQNTSIKAEIEHLQPPVFNIC